MDMKTGVFLSGSTEGAMINAAGCQMARRYRLPSQVGGVAASGSRPGFEVGYQKAISALVPVMAGADQVVGIGGFDRSGCESAEQIVMDCELWNNVLRVWRGIAVDKETLAYDAISRVGPGGYFMKDPHTLKHFRREILIPRISSRPMVPGSCDEPMAVAAREDVKRILKEHRPLELDKSVTDQIKKIVGEYDIAIRGKPAPIDYVDYKA
jgi:trimethylamine--corrinoid protein Co-methyltransferase